MIVRGIDPKDCDLDTQNSLVTHLPTGSHFGITFFDAYHTAWRVTDGPESDFAETPCRNWEDVLERLGYWADEVRYVSETPDYWEQLRQAAEALDTVEHADSSNAPFTPEEQARISTRIGEIKDYIRTTYELTSEQMEHVEERLDAAEQASRRIGRKDWLMAFNGAVFSLFLSDLIPQQAATHIVVMAITGLGHLFGISSMPPSLPPG